MSSKFKNIIVEVNGIKFRSKKESRRYIELTMLKRAGKVISFELQPKYLIAGSGKSAIKYIADFRVEWSSGMITVEDVKGVKTPLYKLKKQLMWDKYGIEIVEI